MVKISAISSRPNTGATATSTPSGDVIRSRDITLVTTARDMAVEDVDNVEEKRRSSAYLHSHTDRSSERATQTLRSVVEEALRDIKHRSKQLEAGIKERRNKIIESLDQPSRDIRIKSRNIATSGVSDLFQLIDRRNLNVRMLNCGDLPDDYKEFMFFDNGSAKHLNYAVRTLGDPSFSISYNRDYNAIALNPEFIGSPGKNLGEFYGPTAVTTDERHKHLYVCDSMNCRVVVYSVYNKPLYTIGQKGKGLRDLDRPSSLAVDKMGQMYIADSFNDRICVYTTEGEWRFNAGGRGELNKPRGVACMKNGEIFVVSDTSNQRILVYSGSGSLKGTFGKLGMKEGRFIRPQGIRIDNNKVYVADSFNYRVQIFDIEGNLLESIGKHGSGPGEFEEPRDIAIDNNGNVLATDTKKNTLQIFDKNGQFIREYGSQGSGQHQFDYPEGVHTDDINRVFIADHKNNRVHIL